MLDFDFSKLMLIAVVAIVVLGPERLPSVARTVGALVGRSRRYLDELKAQVARELEHEELRALTRNATALLDTDTSDTFLGPAQSTELAPSASPAAGPRRPLRPVPGAGSARQLRPTGRYVGAVQARPLRHAAIRTRNRIVAEIAR
jgi:Tat protein translocase TatB subunit